VSLDMISHQSPGIVSKAIAQNDLRPPDIIERKTAQRNTLLIHQREALRADFLRRRRLGVRYFRPKDGPTVARERSARQTRYHRKNQIPFVHAISP